MNWSGNQQSFSLNGGSVPNLDTLMAFNRPAMEAMAEINSRVLEQIAAVNSEWTKFVQRRKQQDFGLPQQLAQCHSPQDFFRIYAEFTQSAFQQYQQEFAEIARMNSGIQQRSRRHHAIEGREGQPTTQRLIARQRFGISSSTRCKTARGFQ